MKEEIILHVKNGSHKIGIFFVEQNVPPSNLYNKIPRFFYANKFYESQFQLKLTFVGTYNEILFNI